MKNHVVDSLVAAVLGATAMYYFDPEMGRRRRAMLRDQFVGRTQEANRYIRRRVRRTGDRLHGLAAEAGHALASEDEPADDRTIGERVRAVIGHVVSTPGSVDVNVSAGSVLLTGHILAAERDKLLSEVSSVRGVDRVSDQLAEYGEPGNVPELQGANKS